MEWCYGFADVCLPSLAVLHFIPIGINHYVEVFEKERQGTTKESSVLY